MYKRQVGTDHGFLLGEHDWWAKNRMPLYEVISHIPLFFYHPKHSNKAGQRRKSLTQTIDLMPTILDLYDAPIPNEVEGLSLVPILENDTTSRTAGMFGYWGGGINIVDGKYTYFCYPKDMLNQDLFQYTLMPTHLRQFFTIEELKSAKMEKPFSFTKGVPIMKIKNDVKGPSIGNNKNTDGKGFIDTESVLYDVLNENKILGLVSDQDAKRKGVFVDFFDKPASTHKGAALFHLNTNASLIFGICVQKNIGQYQVEFIPINPNKKSVEDITQLYTSVIEQSIKKYPEQYFWFHNLSLIHI